MHFGPISRLIRSGAVLIVAGLTLQAVNVMAADGPYKLEQTWELGGDGGWDYLAVDSPAHLLYIARGNRVMVVDTTSGKLVGEIGGLQGVHGIAFDATGKYGYISDGAAGAIRVFDRATRQVTQTVPAGKNPDAIVYEPTKKYVLAMNGRSNDATVLDTATNKVVATISLPGKPEFAVADGKGAVFVNLEDKSEIAKLDLNSLKVTTTWSLSPCESPSGLAMDTAHRRLFSVCDGKKMAVSDADSGKVVATAEIGDGPDAAGFDPKDQFAFSSNGEGNFSVVKEDSPNSYSTIQTLPTKRGAERWRSILRLEKSTSSPPTLARGQPRPPKIRGRDRRLCRAHFPLW